MDRDAEPWEIDAMSLVFIGYMSRSEFDKWIVTKGAKGRWLSFIVRTFKGWWSSSGINGYRSTKSLKKKLKY